MVESVEFNRFPSVSKTEWQDAVEQVLKGKPFEKAMVRDAYDQIGVAALSVAGEAESFGIKSREGDWEIGVLHEEGDNTAIVEDLEGGATSVYLRGSVSDFSKTLSNVYLQMIRVNLDADDSSPAKAQAYMSFAETAVKDLGQLRGNLGLDPVGALARSGGSLDQTKAAISDAAAFATSLAPRTKGVSSFMASGNVYNQAGAPATMECAFAIATALGYLRALEAAGMSVEEASKQIEFSLDAESDIFVTIAKFRAVRLLWDFVLKECGVPDPAPMRLHGRSSLRMLTTRDPWVNLLRNTAACFSAGVGGADDILLVPHDRAAQQSTNQSRRLARNIQIICQEESRLSAVTDPAAGSYALEQLTNDICNRSFAQLQAIEAEFGGMADFLQSGKCHEMLASEWLKREENIAKRKEPITGVSEFPNINEKPAASGAVHLSGTGASEQEIKPLPLHRNAEGFEYLRSRSDAFLAEHGKRPTVFLANMGSVADHTARATFSKNFFEAGGIQTVNNEGFSGASETVTAFKESGADTAVLCGSDKNYERAEGLVEFLKGAGAKTIYVAGKPKNMESLQMAGVNEAIYMGCDAISILDRCLTRMGATS